MKFLYVFVIGVIGLAGCGGSEPEPAAPVERDTVFDPMLETLDKARAVEGLEQDRKRRIDEQLDGG